MAKKTKIKKTPSDKSTLVRHSGVGKGRRSWRKEEHSRNEPYDGSVEESKLMYIKKHNRNPRRNKNEVNDIVNKFVENQELPQKYIIKKRGKSQKTIENPRYIADMRILQRRGLIDSKIPLIEGKSKKQSRLKINIPPVSKVVKSKKKKK